jgi:uncharacterized protein (TIGR03086 family)
MAVDIQGLDRRALAACVEVVARVRPDQLDAPTPCAQWSLRQLLEHMVGSNYGFAAAAEGAQDPADWVDRPVDDDPGGIFAASAARLTSAFDAPDVLTRRMVIPVISPTHRFPAAQAFGFHFIDFVVHGWDVAASLGTPYVLADDILDEALVRAAEVPEGPSRTVPGALFAPGVAAPADAPVMDRVLSMLGRSPRWPDR